jgi:hypothetical protein
VLISNFRRFHRLASYLGRYTNRPLGLAIGASKLAEIFDESFYNENEGGMLGGLGQLFKNPARLYVYPSLDSRTGQVVTAEEFPVQPPLKHLYRHFLENGFIRGLRTYDPQLLRIIPHDVLGQIRSGDATWESFVPPQIVEVIKKDQLFGFGSETAKRPIPEKRQTPNIKALR